MSRSRDSRIKQAPRLAEAFQRLQTYEATPRERNVGSQGPRPPRTTVFVTPYGLDLDTTERAKATVADTDLPILSPLINAAGTQAQIDPALGSNSLVPLQGFRSAKVKWFRNASVSSTPVTSQRTGLKYLKYNGDTFTCPFGRSVAADNMYDAFNQLKTNILAQTGFDMSRVSLIREDFKLQR